MKTTQFISLLLLTATAAVWGITFTVVKDALYVIGPLEYLAVRMTIAAAVISLLSGTRRLTLIGIVPGLIAGVFLFSGYALQTIGLQYSTASRAAFLTGLCVVIVPLLSGLIAHRRPHPAAWIGVLLALIGTSLLTLPTPYGLDLGDMLLLGCAVCFSLQILFVGRYTCTVDTLQFVGSQLWFVALLSLLAAAAFEQWHPVQIASFTPEIWTAILVTAILATSFAFWVQSWAQRVVSPTAASLVFATEPVFATGYALWMGRESVNPLLIAGGSMIVIAMVLGGLSEAQAAETSVSASDICKPKI